MARSWTKPTVRQLASSLGFYDWVRSACGCVFEGRQQRALVEWSRSMASNPKSRRAICLSSAANVVPRHHCPATGTPRARESRTTPSCSNASAPLTRNRRRPFLSSTTSTAVGLVRSSEVCCDRDCMRLATADPWRSDTSTNFMVSCSLGFRWPSAMKRCFSRSRSGRSFDYHP